MRLSLLRSSRMMVTTMHFSSTANAAAVSKADLATLRKKTGYAFSNCKKALEQYGSDLTAAETWLRNQAQANGWAKATQLQDRIVSQGLIGVKFSPEEGTGVLVEINCETDFVARNAKFHELVANVAEVCFRQVELKPIDGASYHKWSITPELLSSFKTAQGKTLGDLTALTIGTMGENMVLRRALLVKTDPKECKISGYAHAADTFTTSKGCSLGRYGALVIYRQLPSSPEEESNESGSNSEKVLHTPDKILSQDIGRQLCQHIVGMNPQSIGRMDDVEEVDETAKKAEAEEETVSTQDEVEKGEQVKKEKDDDTRLIFQEFLADPDLTVRDVLEQNNMEVLDFARFECGRPEVQVQPETK